MSRRAVFVSLFAFALVAGSTPGSATPAPAFRIETEGEGVVRVTHADLVAAGLRRPELPSRALALSNRGLPVPIHVDDGSDGLFQPGDGFEFVTEELPGERTRHHEHSRVNVYRLSLAGDGARLAASSTAAAGSETSSPIPLLVRRHLERDRLLIRLRGEEAEQADPWYWHKLTHVDREPFRLELDLSTLDPSSPGRLRVAVALRGLSSRTAAPAAERRAPDHRVEVSFDGRSAADVEWEGRGAAEASFERPASAVAPGRHVVEARAPRRHSAGGGILDVSLVDAIRVEHPDSGTLGARQRRLHLASPGPGIVVLSGEDGPPVAYTDGGRRVEAVAAAPGRWRFATAEGEASFWAVPPGAANRPAAVTLDAPSTLTGVEHRADYLIVAHASLLEAVRPLAEMHRRRGLAVELVDVQDVYDELNHGIRDPRAIRDFVAHAYHRWRPPAPRFLLLVGDTSWDTKNDVVDDRNYANWVDRQLVGEPGRFAAKPAQAYGDSESVANDRGLLPTWSHPGREGHAASDNFFVAVDGDDHLPDLAVGRLPFVDPQTVADVVAKTIRYSTRPPLGPWRSRLLWVTNESYAFRVRSQALAGRLAGAGWAANPIYPTPAGDPSRLRAELRDALDRGHLVTHFVGHGGRYEWRVAPPDLDRQTDLFTLDDLARLAPSERLTVVLSVACHSAPFDHPSADSIGEAFLRLPDRGAIGVVAASWRNAPGPELSDALVTELLAAPTLGEALRRAKRRVVDRELVATYNLLGDPAIPLARPRLTAKVEELAAVGDRARVRVVLPDEALGGRAVASWSDTAGAPLRTEPLDADGPIVDLVAPAAARALQIYFWNEDSGADGAAGLALRARSPDAATTTRP